MKPLFTSVAKVETAADKVLNKLEEQRIADINEVLNHYKAKFQEQYKLDGEKYLPRIEYRKNYYNKGMDEKTRKDDLEQQFKGLKKEQDVYSAAIRLIKAACADEPRLNVVRYIRDLETINVASVVEEINTEKNRLRQLDQTETTTATGEAVEVDVTEAAKDEEPAKVVIGIPAELNFNSDFQGRNRTMKIEITYPCDLGDALTDLFASLKQHGIKIRQLKEETVF
jgi:hypothetical protein